MEIDKLVLLLTTWVLTPINLPAITVFPMPLNDILMVLIREMRCVHQMC